MRKPPFPTGPARAILEIPLICVLSSTRETASLLAFFSEKTLLVNTQFAPIRRAHLENTGAIYQPALISLLSLRRSL